MAFDPQQFFADLSRDYNVFNPENPINRGVTAAWQGSPIGKSLIGGPQAALEGGATAGDNRPWTADEINQFVEMARGQGLNDQQIQMFLDNTAGAQGRGQTPWNRDIANQHIANALYQNKMQGVMNQGDVDLGTYLADLDKQQADEFAALDAQGARFAGMLKDPSTIKTDAEYGHMLREAEQMFQGSRVAARNQGASISASRGSGFSGASLGAAQRADADAVRNYANTESGMFSDIVGRNDALGRYRASRATSYGDARNAGKTANNAFKSGISSSQLGQNTDFWRSQYGDSIAPRMLQQSESERGLQQYFMNPFQHALDTTAGVVSNATNQIPGVIRGS